MYGHPINLTYKNDKTYKSILGGIFTIISITGILSFLAIELNNVI